MFSKGILLANKREKAITFTMMVLDCDECGTEIWEISSHERADKPFWEITDWYKVRELPTKQLCENCCDGGCLDGDMLHG